MMNEINEMLNNRQTTENGAVGFKTTHNNLVDINFALPSLRNGLTQEIIDKFKESINEDVETCAKFLFFVRDAREGVGERNIFKNLYKVFYETKPVEAVALLSLIGEYGRWDDIVNIAFTSDTNLKMECFKIIESQLKSDTLNCVNNKHISLCAKWIPSINASAKARKQAIELCNFLQMSKGSYRKMLSKLREYLDVTERKTCANDWSAIDYNKVSSNANLRYSNSFIKHDEIRRREYLESLKKGDTSVKMNAGVLTPCEIWSKYKRTGDYSLNYYHPVIKEDDSFEMMWKNLKDMGNIGNTMCVVDGSGSMGCSIPNSSVEAIDVSRSLGVYFAEHCSGEFHNKMIEFSSRPRYIDLDGKETLAEKIMHMNKYDACSNTDIEAVFNLILNTAIQYKIPQSEMPDRILIVSDMEFDYATTMYNCRNSVDFKPLFVKISNKFSKYRYTLPKLVFWNVNSRTNTIPLTQNEAGVVLISGYSTNLLKLVMSNQTDPWLILKETLDSERYNLISDTLKSLNND